MFGPLGIPELIFIFGLALLVFGPRKLPEIGRTIGRSLAEFRKATTDLKRSLNAEMIEEEIRQSDPRKLLADEPKAGSAAKKPRPADVEQLDVSSAEPDQAPGTVSRGSVLDVDDAASSTSEGLNPVVEQPLEPKAP